MFDEIIEQLSDLPGRETHFAAGEAVFHHGDSVELVYFVRSGIIHLIRHQSDGAALVLQRAGPKSVLAEASVFSGVYHCEAVARRDATAWAVPRNLLKDRLATDAAFSQTWMEWLSREVQRARMQAEIVSLKTVSARLDAWLEWRGPLPPKGEWAALSSELGVSPEAFYREIARRRP